MENKSGKNNSPHQPKIMYKGKCNHFNLPGPKIPIKVIPVAIITHWITQNQTPKESPNCNNKIGV